MLTKGIPSMPVEDEQQLILQVKEGSHDAFRVLVERYMRQAYDVAYGFVNDHDDAEDIAQEAFVRVHQSITSFRGESKFSTWLYRIVMNLSLSRVRQKQQKAQREVQMLDPIVQNLGKDSSAVYQIDVQMHIERALHQLPTLQRAVVILRHIDGLSTKQVSGILHCSEGTVKTHLHRGLKKMRTLLGFLKMEDLS
jgi:RNA polymerase sigma-70 factor (ECF subfamily)